MGGHWNFVSGGAELSAFCNKAFGTDGALTFPQFKAWSNVYGRLVMPLLAPQGAPYHQQLTIDQIAELHAIAKSLKREWSNPEMTKE